MKKFEEFLVEGEKRISLNEKASSMEITKASGYITDGF
jgi:hypothetical protein